MTDIEVILTDLGEVTTKDIIAKEHPQGLKENLLVAKKGGYVLKMTRNWYDKTTNQNAVSKKNQIRNRYLVKKK